MDKFQRNYRLLVETQNGEIIEIDPPFTMEFDIQRNVLQSTNVGSVRVYNLAKETRRKIYKDDFTYDVYLKFQLMAGYGATMPTIFKGNLKRAWSVREGVDFITTIEGFDGGDALINSQINEAFKSGTPTNKVMETILASFQNRNVSIGAIGSFPGTLPRGNSVSGNSADLANALSKGGFFVDLEKAYCLNDSECIAGSLLVINSDSGLLGTPVRDKTTLTFDILFEPRILIGQLITLDSITGDNFNGDYRVISVKHRGMISEAVCGNAVTSLGLWKGLETLTVVPSR